MVLVRDTKANGTGPVLTFTPRTWAAFAAERTVPAAARFAVISSLLRTLRGPCRPVQGDCRPICLQFRVP